MFLKFTLWLTVCFLCPLALVAQPQSSDTATEIPFKLQNGAVLIDVTLKGKGPFTMGLATGSPHSSLDHATISAAGYQANFTYDPRTFQYPVFVQATGMEIGGLKINTLSMKVSDMSSYAQELGRPLHGILGYDFFKGRVVQIDYKQKVVRFLPKNTYKAMQKAGVPASAAPVVAPMELISEDPVPIVKEIAVNGVKFKAMLDTWQNLPLALTPAALKQLALPVAAEKTPPQIKPVESLQFAELKLTAPQAAWYSKGTGLDHGLAKYGAIVGAGFLSRYVVTFDYANKLIVIE